MNYENVPKLFTEFLAPEHFKIFFYFRITNVFLY